MEKEKITNFLAIWGAIVSSITFGWNLYRDLSKRGKLRVICYIGNIVTESIGIDEKNYLVWNVTNIGGEPIILTHIGGALKNKKHFMIKPRNVLPLTLKPGEYILEYTSDLSVLDKNLKKLWALDSRNRKFKASWKQVRSLKKEFLAGVLSKKS